MQNTNETPKDENSQKEYKGFFNLLVRKPFDKGVKLVFPGQGITIQKIDGEVLVKDNEGNALSTEATLKSLNFETLLNENES